jgi:hypothetical protein
MLIPIAAFFVFAVVMIAWGVITGEIAGPTKSKKLLDLRHRLWAGAPDEAGVDLLDRTRVVFVQVVDASGELLGTVRRQGRRAFVLHDAWGLPVGLIKRRSGAGVDYALRDRSGRDLGTISDYWHLAERAEPPRTDRWTRLKKALDGHVAREHVLELRDPHLNRESRALLLGAAASVYLAFQALPRRWRLTAFHLVVTCPGLPPDQRATTEKRGGLEQKDPATKRPQCGCRARTPRHVDKGRLPSGPAGREAHAATRRGAGQRLALRLGTRVFRKTHGGRLVPKGRSVVASRPSSLGLV